MALLYFIGRKYISLLRYCLNVPEWKVHDEWAVRLGVSKKVSREINEFVDFPEKWFKKHYSTEDLEKYEIRLHSLDEEPCLSLFKLSKLSKKFGHDMGKKAKWQAHLQLECAYLHYGSEGVKALVLHHILDYITLNIFVCLIKIKYLKKLKVSLVALSTARAQSQHQLRKFWNLSGLTWMKF